MNTKQILSIVVLALSIFSPPRRIHAEMGRLAKLSQIQSWKMLGDLTVFLVEDHRVPLVEINVLFPVGSWSPWVRKNQIETAFNIQKMDSQGRLANKAEQLALSIDTGVYKHNADLSLFCLKEDVQQAAQLLADVLSNHDFDHSELVRSTWAAGPLWEANEKDPNFVLSQAVHRLYYQKEDPRRWIVERPPMLSTSIKKLLEARDTYIRFPGRIIAIAGDLTKAEAKQVVEKLGLPTALRELPQEPPVNSTFFPWNPDRKDTVIALPGLTQSYFNYSRTGLSLRDPEFPMLLLANHIFGEQFNSRLYMALREKEGDTYSPQVNLIHRVIPSFYDMVVYTRASNTSAMEGKLRETVAQFSREGVTAQERLDAINYFRGNQAFWYREPSSVMGRAIGDYMQGLPTGFSDLMFENLQAVSLEDLNHFIRRFYDPKQFTMVKLVPKP